MVGLHEVDAGEILYSGEDFTKLDFKERIPIRKEIGMLFQSSALFDSMNVEENLLFPLNMFSDMSNSEKSDRVDFCLKRVNLDNVRKLAPSELSGGMKRRIALARTLILKPKIILYDEPTTGLDPITSKEIVLLMNSIQKQYNTSSIIITHDVDCAKVIANRMILLIDGKNYIEGTFDESDNGSIYAIWRNGANARRC